MLRLPSGPVLVVALLAAVPCLAETPAPQPQPQPSGTAPTETSKGLQLPDKPPVCLPLPPITS